MESITPPRYLDSPEHIFINDIALVANSITTNSLTEEACIQFQLESVDLHTVQTELHREGANIASFNTYALIYFSPDKIDLRSPLTIQTCVTFSELDYDYSSIDVYSFNHGHYIHQDYQFRFKGDVGCTSMLNLGFYLLNRLQGVKAQSITTLTLLDTAWMYQNAYQDKEVVDESIIEFCRINSCDIIPLMSAASDCPYYIQCKHQEGERCKFLKAECR